MLNGQKRGLPIHKQQEKVLISSWPIPLHLNLKSNNYLPGQSCVSRQRWRTLKWKWSVSGDAIGIFERQLTKNSQQICSPHSKTKMAQSPKLCNEEKAGRVLLEWILRRWDLTSCKIYTENLFKNRFNSLHKLDLQLNGIIYFTGWSFGLGCIYFDSNEMWTSPLTSHTISCPPFEEHSMVRMRWNQQH